MKKANIEEKDWSWINPMKDLFEKGSKIDNSNYLNKGYRSDLGDKDFSGIKFRTEEFDHFVGEVGVKDKDFIFHFFSNYPSSFDEIFKNTLSEAFLDIFRFEDKLFLSHDKLYVCERSFNVSNNPREVCSFKGKEEDLNQGRCPDCSGLVKLVLDAWAVKAIGFAQNPLAEGLPSKLFKKLDSLLESKNG